VAPAPTLKSSGLADPSDTPLSINRLFVAEVLIELALTISELDEARFSEISIVDEGPPRVSVPEPTEMVSELTVELLPRATLGPVIDRLPLLTVCTVPSARISAVEGLNNTRLPVPVPALGAKAPVVPANVNVLPET